MKVELKKVKYLFCCKLAKWAKTAASKGFPVTVLYKKDGKVVRWSAFKSTEQGPINGKKRDGEVWEIYSYTLSKWRTMKELNPKLVAKVSAAMKGARLAKFQGSIDVLNQSLALGGWIPRGSVKAQSGFYQGLMKMPYERNASYNEHKSALEFCLNYGSSIRPKDIKKALQHAPVNDKGVAYLDNATILAWVELCAEKDAAFQLLNDARPLPTITPIGLSPKVTKTLKECNLDLDLPSICRAKLDFKWIQSRDEKTGELLFVDGKPKMVKWWFVKWSKGIVHGQSRFAYSGGCESCGKHIPSGRYVPIEAKDKKLGKLISMWIGCDCARNIFGIKDIGIKKS